MLNHRIRLITIALLAVLGLVLLAGSVASAQSPAPATAPATSTATFTPTKVVTSTVPVTSTATTVPPTATKLPATATLVPPTATKVPPTATLVPPTATKVPPTATKVPPTATKAPTTAAKSGARANSRFAFSYTSGFQLQNLAGSDASVTIIFYNQDGSVAATVPDTITAAAGSKTYFPLPIPGSAPFNGSVVISSNVALAAVVNIVGGNFAANAAYDGSNAGSSTVSLPLLMKNNSGFNTWFNVQNATNTSTDAVVNVAYSDGTNAGPITIKPGAAATFTQSTETHNAAVFSGVVTNASTNQPLAVTAIQEDPATLFAYSGFGPTSGSPNPVMPLINSNNGGILTGVQIQNTGADSTITVTYTPSLAGTSCTEQQFIPAGQSKTFALYAFAGVPLGGMTTNCAAHAKFIGSAQVTGNTGNSTLAAIVDQLLPGNYGEAYGGFNPALATQKTVMPLIEDNNSGYYTGFNVMNVGPATTVTCTFSGTSYSISQMLGTNQALTDIQFGKIRSGYVGSGSCSGANTTDKIVSVVNEYRPSALDEFLVYEGINQ